MNSNELVNLRRRLGWSQTKLANHLGVSQAAVSWWERGFRAIPTVEALEHGMGVARKLERLAKKGVV